MASANPCVVTNVLANDYTNAVRAINRKFNALQRLAELLEQLGDIAGALPNISALVPLYLINLDAYTNLVQACPFLNLPKSPSNEDLAALQEKVATAYANLIKQIQIHPFNRLSKLQAQMDKVQLQFNSILNDGQQFLTCLQQACTSADVVANFVSSFSSADAQSDINQFTRNYLGASGQVLTQTMQGKVSVVQGLIDNLNALMTTVPVITPNQGPVIPQIPIPTNHPIPNPPAGPVT